MSDFEEKEIRSAYKALLNDPDFERLELELGKPNIFQILNIGNAEIRHSNFLAWLLNPTESHGLGKVFLIKFLRDIATSEVLSELDELEIEQLNFTQVEIRREWKNIDLLLIIDDLVVCIENKFYSQDHSRQLTKYRELVNEFFPSLKKAFVYLTPNGDAPKQADESEFYATYSYEELVSHAQNILSIYGENILPGVRQYIQDYLTTLKRELMKNDIANELANKLFKNHRTLFNFILEHKSDLATELLPFFKEQVKLSGWVEGSPNKGYIRFLTPTLNMIVPRDGVGWPYKESFLFEIDFYWNKKNAVFKTVIAPSRPEVHELLKTAIESIPDHKKPYGKKWLVHYMYSWRFEKEEGTEPDPEQVQKSLESAWPKIQEIVEKVEQAILPYADQLKAFQSNSGQLLSNDHEDNS